MACWRNRECNNNGTNQSCAGVSWAHAFWAPWVEDFSADHTVMAFIARYSNVTGAETAEMGETEIEEDHTRCCKARVLPRGGERGDVSVYFVSEAIRGKKNKNFE